MKTFALPTFALLSFSLLLSGCTLLDVSNPQATLSRAAQGHVTGPSFTRLPDGGTALTGKIAGNAFAVRVPPVWNGQSVIYAHGYNTPFPGTREIPPTAAFDPEATAADSMLIKDLYRQGFAVAESNYAKVGYAVKEGAEATIALQQLFARAGVRKQYLVGVSMGGNIVTKLIEKYPTAFVGALPLCGVVAGWGDEVRYLVDFNVIYAYFTKGTPYEIPGLNAVMTPDPATTQEAINASVIGLFTAAGKGDTAAQAIIGQVAKVTGAPADPISFLTPLTMLPVSREDLLTTQQGLGYSNVGRVYSGSADDKALNAGVERVTATAPSAAYVAENYTPSGRFQTKVLSVHNLSDPLVPYSQQAEYARIVTAAGNRANLVQQVVDPRPVNTADLENSGPAHCFFTREQLGRAWNDLRQWVEQDVRPVDGLNITRPRT